MFDIGLFLLGHHFCRNTQRELRNAGQMVGPLEGKKGLLYATYQRDHTCKEISKCSSKAVYTGLNELYLNPLPT